MEKSWRGKQADVGNRATSVEVADAWFSTSSENFDTAV